MTDFSYSGHRDQCHRSAVHSSCASVTISPSMSCRQARSEESIYLRCFPLTIGIFTHQTVIRRINYTTVTTTTTTTVTTFGFYRTMLRRARLCRAKSSVRLSIRPSVTFRYRDHIGWNTSKKISRLNNYSLRYVLGLTPIWAIWCNGNAPNITVE